MHYKQADVAKERGLNRSKIKELRDYLLEEDQHWWKEGTVIWWNAEAVDMLDKHLAEEHTVPPPAHPYLETADDIVDDVLVVSQCKNPNWVIGRLEGERVQIQIPRRLAGRMVGKRVSVAMVDSDGGIPYYTLIP